MTEYLAGFVTEDTVKSRSRQEAVLRGCRRQPEDVTEFWQDWVKHPDKEEWALIFYKAEHKTNLSLAEEGRLLDSSWVSVKIK